MQTSSARTASSFAGIDDGRGHRILDVKAARAVAFLAADVPFGDGLGLDVVVHRMTAVAERSGRTLHLVGRIVLSPPIGAGFDVIPPPRLGSHVPLRRKHEVVVAAFREVPLLPLAAVGERDVFLAKGHQRVRR